MGQYVAITLNIVHLYTLVCIPYADRQRQFLRHIFMKSTVIILSIHQVVVYVRSLILLLPLQMTALTVLSILFESILLLFNVKTVLELVTLPIS